MKANEVYGVRFSYFEAAPSARREQEIIESYPHADETVKTNTSDTS